MQANFSSVALEIVVRRRDGQSWAKLAREMGLSAREAKTLYNNAIRELEQPRKPAIEPDNKVVDPPQDWPKHPRFRALPSLEREILFRRHKKQSWADIADEVDLTERQVGVLYKGAIDKLGPNTQDWLKHPRFRSLSSAEREILFRRHKEQAWKRAAEEMDLSESQIKSIYESAVNNLTTA